MLLLFLPIWATEWLQSGQHTFKETGTKGFKPQREKATSHPISSKVEQSFRRQGILTLARYPMVPSLDHASASLEQPCKERTSWVSKMSSQTFGESIPGPAQKYFFLQNQQKDAPHQLSIHQKHVCIQLCGLEEKPPSPVSIPEERILVGVCNYYGLVQLCVTRTECRGYSNLVPGSAGPQPDTGQVPVGSASVWTANGVGRAHRGDITQRAGKKRE